MNATPPEDRAGARFLYHPRPLSPARAGNSTPMPPIYRIPLVRRALAIIAATAAAVSISGCVYRPTIQQGNLLQLDEIDQVKVGMTRSQVRYVLGTPMISDPFEPNRWDYVYTLQKGHDTHIDRAHFVVLFEDDKVIRVDKLTLPEDSDVAKRVRAERDKKAAAEAKATQSPSGTPAAAGTPAETGTPVEPESTPAPDSGPPASPPPPGGA
jgi:outer membrane protein assembly factor BamE